MVYISPFELDSLSLADPQASLRAEEIMNQLKPLNAALAMHQAFVSLIFISPATGWCHRVWVPSSHSFTPCLAHLATL